MFRLRLKSIVWSIGAVALTALIAGGLAGLRSRSPLRAEGKHVVLVGASIGQAWQLSRWPNRTGTAGVTTEAIAVWQFDKSDAIAELAMRPARPFHLSRTYLRSLFQPAPTPPSIVILKECSSYFPGDSATYKAKLDGWVRALQAKGMTVVVSTVIPVTLDRAQRDHGKLEAIIEFNRWIRRYAAERKLVLLDLDDALHDPSDLSLRADFAQPDGSHLTPNAYRVLDQLLATVLCDDATIRCNAVTKATILDMRSEQLN